MKVTGSTLRRALVRWTMRRDQLAKQFEKSVFAFEGENKKSLDEIAREFLVAAGKVADIQVAQQEFNAKVRVQFNGSIAPLANAIKIKSDLGRLKNLWQSVASAEDKSGSIWERHRGGISRPSYNKDTVQAEMTISVSQAMDRLEAATVAMTELSDAISFGNSQEAEVEIDPGLLA